MYIKYVLYMYVLYMYVHTCHDYMELNVDYYVSLQLSYDNRKKIENLPLLWKVCERKFLNTENKTIYKKNLLNMCFIQFLFLQTNRKTEKT